MAQLPVLEKWLSSLSSQKAARCYILQFEAWCRQRGEFKNLTDMVTFQKQATNDDRYRIVDLAEAWVKERGGTARTMSTRFTAVRSFFLHNRAELPKTRVNFMPTRDSVVGRLTLETFAKIVKAATVRNRAIYLTLFQGLMDQARFVDFNRRYGFALGEHIKRGANAPFKVEFLKGRKINEAAFSTWIGRDALEAWKLYFDTIRRYPKEGEAAAVEPNGKPVTEWAIYHAHLSLLRKLNLIKKSEGDLHTRTGMNPHEIRDLARSVLEKAKSENFNTNSAEFWMGHTVDKFFYNKVWKLDPDYNLEQYRIAEKYLSILSHAAPRMDEGMVTRQLTQILESWERAGAFQNPALLHELLRLAKAEAKAAPQAPGSR